VHAGCEHAQAEQQGSKDDALAPVAALRRRGVSKTQTQHPSPKPQNPSPMIINWFLNNSYNNFTSSFLPH
jgi:hypothetical protein